MPYLAFCSVVTQTLYRAKPRRFRRSSARTSSWAALERSRRTLNSIACRVKFESDLQTRGPVVGRIHEEPRTSSWITESTSERSSIKKTFTQERPRQSSTETLGECAGEASDNHRARRHRTNASEPSLLYGLVFDQEGRSLHAFTCHQEWEAVPILRIAGSQSMFDR